VATIISLRGQLSYFLTTLIVIYPSVTTDEFNGLPLLETEPARSTSEPQFMLNQPVQGHLKERRGLCLEVEIFLGLQGAFVTR